MVRVPVILVTTYTYLLILNTICNVNRKVLLLCEVSLVWFRTCELKRTLGLDDQRCSLISCS